jgi:DNA-binding transcriptional LysR family regulator
LRLALKADFDAGMLPRILAAFRREEAALPVELLQGSRGEQVPALRDGRADVAMLPTPFDDRGLDVEPLLTEPRLIALPAGDPLAAHDGLSLADLAGRRLPDGTPADRPASQRVIDIEPSRLDLTQIFNLIELGDTVMYLPVSVAQRHVRPGIAYRAVAGLPPSTLAVAWPQDSHSPAVAAFVRAAAAVAATHSAATMVAAS